MGQSPEWEQSERGLSPGNESRAGAQSGSRASAGRVPETSHGPEPRVGAERAWAESRKRDTGLSPEWEQSERGPNPGNESRAGAQSGSRASAGRVPETSHGPEPRVGAECFVTMLEQYKFQVEQNNIASSEASLMMLPSIVTKRLNENTPAQR
eukprot:g36322.t1